VISSSLSGNDNCLYWVHAASLGEYNVVRPIIRQIRKSRDVRIVLTFFSPTGVESLRGLKPEYSDADYVFFLPLDTRMNVSSFMDIVKPQKAIFVISEYWVNYLSELRARQIPTYLLSAVITEKSSVMRWYGKFYHKYMSAFTCFMVLDDVSRYNLRRIGFNNSTVIRNPLFDNAVSVAATPYYNRTIEQFCSTSEHIFIAGSISDDNDLKLVSFLANSYNDVKFIFVPHEISEESLNNILYSLDVNVKLYSECYDHDESFSDVQVLIIDFLGALSYIYRYADYAYVGGGFTPFLHNLLEPTVYGLPVSFGPRTHRKIVPAQLVECGIGQVVHSIKEINRWFASLKDDRPRLENIREKAKEYVMKNAGATKYIIETIENCSNG